MSQAASPAPKVLRLTRRYRFSASHRLDTARLSPEQNRKLYGKCNNPYGHGHDYILDVTIEGETDANGQLVDGRELDTVVSEQVLARLDHRNLNADLPEFAGVVPTTENLAFLIRDSLTRNWTLPAKLAAVRISETARNMFELETGK